jgi:Erythromycin esterase
MCSIAQHLQYWHAEQAAVSSFECATVTTSTGAHNSHLGDARFTDMGKSRGEVNLGQLTRQRWGPRLLVSLTGAKSDSTAARCHLQHFDWPAQLYVCVASQNHSSIEPSRRSQQESIFLAVMVRTTHSW